MLSRSVIGSFLHNRSVARMSTVSLFKPENLLKTNPPQDTFKLSTVNLHTTRTLLDSGEEAIIATLAKAFPTATDMAVVDVSGGCGSMYEVYVESPDFKGMRIVKQHQTVTKALSQQISNMHGIRISTKVSPDQTSDK